MILGSLGNIKDLNVVNHVGTWFFIGGSGVESELQKIIMSLQAV